MGNRALPVLLWAAAAASGQPGRAPAPEEYEGRIIRSIEVTGNFRVSREALLSRMETKEGRPFSLKVLAQDLKDLVSVHRFFLDVTPRVEPVEGGVKLTLQVIENPLIRRLEFQGLDDLDEKDLKEVLGVGEGKFASEYTILSAERAIRDLYHEKGHRYAEVTATLLPGPEGNTLRFVIVEGPKTRVERVEFHGNRAFDAARLRKEMRLEETSLLVRGLFDEELLKSDLVSLKEFYRQESYKDVDVYLLDLRTSGDRSRVTIVIGIDEGPSYTIESIEVKNNRVFPTEEILALFRLKPGEPWSLRRSLEDTVRLRRHYGQHAYLNVKIPFPPQEVISLEGPRVKLIYTVDEGPKVILGQVKIVGNVMTQDKVILRELAVAPGQYVDIREVEKSLARLRALRYFEELGEPEWEETDSPGVKNMILRVKEVETGRLSFAIGVGSDAGLLGSVSLIKDNFDIADLPESLSDMLGGTAFTGAGQRLILEAAPGSQVSTFRIAFQEPYVFDTRWGWSVNLFRTYRNFDEDWSEDRLGINTGFLRRLNRDLGFENPLIGRLDLRIERIRVDVDEFDDAPLNASAVEGNNRLMSFRPSLSYDNTDDPLFPSRGFHAETALEAAGGPLSGDDNFLSWSVDLKNAHSLHETRDGRHHVLSLHGQFRVAREYGDSPDVPIYERFFAGGSSLRGFKYRTVSPKSNDESTGGEALWLMSTEFQFPVYERILQGILFVDTGAVGEDLSDRSFGDVRVGLGAGVRVRIPFLGPIPFAVDFGFPVLKERDDDKQLVSFSLGRIF